MSKAELQSLFLTRVKEYCNYSQNCSQGAKRIMHPIEFTNTMLHVLSEPIISLKRETFNELKNAYLNSLEREDSERYRERLLEVLDRSISDNMFQRIEFAMRIKAKETLKKLLSEIQISSLIEEERKLPEERDREAEKKIQFMYDRVGFLELEERFASAPVKSEEVLIAILNESRKCFAEFCCAIHVPMNNDDTLSPFMLMQLDALIAANERLLKRLRSIQFNQFNR